MEATNPQAVDSAYRTQVAPYLNRMSPDGMTPPATYAEAKPKMMEAKARIAMMDAGGATDLPSGFRQFELTAKAAGLQPGTAEYQQAANIALGREGRAATGGFGFELIKGADGRERMGRMNPRTGQMEVLDETTNTMVPLGGGAALNTGAPIASPVPAGLQSLQYTTDDGSMIPPEEMAAAQAAMQAAARGQDVNIRVGGAIPASPSVAAFGVSRSPEEQAALTTQATEQAKIDAEIGAYDRMTRLEADRAGAVAASTADGKAAAERTEAVRTRVRDTEASIQTLEEAIRILPQATGGMAGAAADSVAGAAGYSTQGARANAQLKLLAAELVSKVPRFEGPQSNVDVQFYREAAGDLANDNLPTQTRMAAAQKMLDLRRKYLTFQGTGAAAKRVSNASEYDALPSGETYIAPDGSVRRKR